MPLSLFPVINKYSEHDCNLENLDVAPKHVKDF